MMGWFYTRKCRKEFYKSSAKIIWTLHDLAYAAAHGRIGHDEFIRLGKDASELLGEHGHLVRGKTFGLWPPPRNGFPKPKQKHEEMYDNVGLAMGAE